MGKLAGGQSIKITGLDGDDGIASGLANLTLAGGIELDAGDGFNGIGMGAPDSVMKIGKLKTGESILFDSGVDDDGIVLLAARLNLDGGIKHTDGGGLNGLDITNFGLVKIGKLAGGQSVNLAGVADAGFEVRLGGTVTLGGSFELTAGTQGADVDFIGKVSVGKDGAGLSVLVTGGDGRNGVSFQENLTLAGGVQFTGGDDVDRLAFDGMEFLKIKGNVEFIGEAGDDEFLLDARSAAIDGNVTFTGGDDTDLVDFLADGSIAGNVNLDLGSSTILVQEVALASHSGLPGALVLKSALTVKFDRLAFDDSFTMTNVSVAKLIDITMGDGISKVTIDNFFAGDEFKLATGNGADVVNIERGDFFGGSVIKKLATIMLGAGDDQLAIGNPLPAVIAPFPDHCRVNFLGGLSADGGGQANDDRNDIVGQNDGVLLAGLTNFALNTLV